MTVTGGHCGRLISSRLFDRRRLIGSAIGRPRRGVGCRGNSNYTTPGGRFPSEGGFSLRLGSCHYGTKIPPTFQLLTRLWGGVNLLLG